jgi:glycine/D-amino acid oxidase-like deaminating enzyme
MDEWPKDVAPSDALRRWFGHDPGRGPEFVHCHSDELDAKRESWRPIIERARAGKVTLLFAARDVDHDTAAALARYLGGKLARGRRDPRQAAVRRSAARRGEVRHASRCGVTFSFEKKLLATGGAPRKLPIGGGGHAVYSGRSPTTACCARWRSAAAASP